jgi:sporulation protein YlmC with PRC-barrel domain
MQMKGSEFIGMTVLDKNAKKVGKIAEMEIKLKKCVVNKIFISTGSAIGKRYFTIVEEDIEKVGDYVQLNLDKVGINEKVHVDKVDEFVEKGSRFKEIVGKVVVSQEGLEVGKIGDMIIEPKGCLINNIVITTGSIFRKKDLTISDKDIDAIGDYVMLKLKKDDLETRTTD